MPANQSKNTAKTVKQGTEARGFRSDFYELKPKIPAYFCSASQNGADKFERAGASIAMTKEQPEAAKRDSKAEAAKIAAAKPDWTNGLRQLYDDVVEEPLPDSFKDLLSKLDD